MAGKGKFGKFVEDQARGALEGLTDVFGKRADAPVDESKRDFLKMGAAAPIVGAGALAGIKIGKKLIDDVPTPAKKEVAQEVAKKLDNVTSSSYDWINEVYAESPKLRQMVGKSIQKSFVDEMMDEEILDASVNTPHWVGNKPSDYEKVFIEYGEDGYGPSIDFGLMGGDEFKRDLNKFLIGEKPDPGGMFAEFSNAYKRQYKSEFPEESVNSKEFEAGQREFFMKQLFSENIVDDRLVGTYSGGGYVEGDKIFDLDKIFKKIEDDKRELGPSEEWLSYIRG